MCTCARPYGRAGRCGFGGQGVTKEGLGGAALVGRVLQMVSEPTLAVACTGQCVDIGCMVHVGLGWDTWHGIWVSTGCTVVRLEGRYQSRPSRLRIRVSVLT
jgi:hypothetical protein